MRIFRIYFILLCTLTFSSAQDTYFFKIGKGSNEFPIKFEDMGPAGITDIAVYGDTVYSLESSKLHILPLKGTAGRYVRIALGKDERAAAINILTADTVAVIVHYMSRRSIGVLLVAAKTGEVLSVIDYRRDTGCNDDQIVIQENQNTAYIHGCLYIPVTDTRNLDKDPASFLIVNLKSKKWQLQLQADYFKEGYVKARTITSFCDNSQILVRIVHGEYKASVNGVDEKVSIKVERNGKALNVPFKLDCRTNRLWCWQTVNDSTVIISGLMIGR